MRCRGSSRGGRLDTQQLRLALSGTPGAGFALQAGAFKIGDAAGTLDNIVACKVVGLA